MLYSCSRNLFATNYMLLLMCRAIELVERIATSEHDQSAMLAKSALRTLLDANLPAKYWVTGSLDMTDSIVNIEFYDAGPVRLLLDTNAVVYSYLLMTNRHSAVNLSYPYMNSHNSH